MKIANDTRLREVSLFTGYAGFSLGLRLAGLETRTIAYCEIEPYCQELIRARIRDGYLDWAPIIGDVRAADFRPLAGLVDIVTAGFPCQPHSTAGKRRGAADERNLWPDTLRVIREMGPGIVLLENVPGILSNGYGGTVVGQLSELGYDCRWGLVSAAAVGAPHLRRRWWCLAYATGSRPAKQTRQYEAMGRSEQPSVDGKDRDVADSPEQGLERANGYQSPQRQPARLSRWQIEPPLGRVGAGYTDWVGEQKALGNGIVPAVVAEFLRRIA